MTIYIGIDQSYTSAGVCIVDEHMAIQKMYTFNTSSSDGDVFKRAYTIATHVGGLVNDYKPNWLGLEGLAFAKFGDATRDLAGLQFMIVNHLRYNCNFSNIVIPSPNEVKKYATGKGNSDKAAMHAALPADVKASLEEKKYRKTTGLYDITDAYWIAKYAIEYGQKQTTKKTSDDTRTE